MRIVGSIEGTPYKITILKMDTRYTLKFETGDYELAYKLRETAQLASIEAVEAFGRSILEAVNEQFQAMHRAASVALATAVVEDEFEVII